MDRVSSNFGSYSFHLLARRNFISRP